MQHHAYGDKGSDLIHMIWSEWDTYFIHEGKRYYMDFNRMFGPTFWHDYHMNKIVDFDDIPQEVWDKFQKWHDKRKVVK